MTLQRGERILSYATGAIALLFAIVAQILISVGKTTKSSRSGHELVVALLVVFAVALLVFARKSKRAGVIFCNMFLLLILGIANGAVFLFSGGYLMIRALRLQRYGDATFAGSSKIARERAKARKEGRDASAITAATLSDAPATEPRRK